MKPWPGTAVAVPSLLEFLETDVMRPVAVFPRGLPVRLQALMDVHLLVTSHRWQARHDSPDGTVHRFLDGPVIRSRYRPPLERTPTR